MDKSEDLSKNSQIIDRWKEKNREDITDHKHTHIQVTNSHWQLRLSHWSSHTAFILTPLAKPNNDKYQEFNIAGCKNGWTRWVNYWLEMLNKIDKAYKTTFAYQVLYDSRMYNYKNAKQRLYTLSSITKLSLDYK